MERQQRETRGNKTMKYRKRERERETERETEKDTQSNSLTR